MAPALPTGTVTFLLTDVEGSSRLWEAHPEAMRAALARHDALVEALTERHGGCVVRPRGEGDSRFAVFARATDALAAALAVQRALHAEPWPTPEPLRVRMALHTGEADLRDGDYYGSAVNRCARLRDVAHGGQVLLSATVRDLAAGNLPADAALRDLGAHRLRDLGEPERVFQLLGAGLPDGFPPPRSLDALHHNLPLQVTSFVGRGAAMAELRRLLGGARLLTVTGAGGCGKTRLALQVAADLIDGYPDGVWFVDLAPLADPTLVPQTVLVTLGVREVPAQPALAALLDHLRPRTALVVLDNCEHLVDACARLADALIRRCPAVRVLATSRALLGVPGEVAWRTPSLALPDPNGGSSRCEAVELFVERARLSQPDFALTERNAAAAAEICRRLDGIPLAIELAAARVRVLAVEQIAARLDDRFRLLTGGSRTALRRQQTLQAMVDWSHDLLGEPERALLRRLSVFAGGFSLAAAEAVCGTEPIEADGTLDALAGLVDKSLVLAEETPDGTRYWLLETIRQYAAQKLVEAGEAASARDRHRGWYVAWSEAAAPELSGPHQAIWLDRLELEHDNLRAALAWDLAAPDGGQAALGLAGALWRFWFLRGYLGEGSAWLEKALAAGDGPAAARARALVGAAFLADFRGDYRQAASLGERALPLARAAGDGWLTALALAILGDFTSFEQREHARAAGLYEQALALAREAGDRWLIAYALAEAGELARVRYDHERAAALAAEGLALARAIGDRWLEAFLLFRLGSALAALGDYLPARRAHEDALAIRRELGDRLGVAYALLGLGEVARLQGDYGAAQAYFEERLQAERALPNQTGVAHALNHLGLLAYESGDHARARALFGESLELCRALDYRWGTAHQLRGLGEVAAAEGDLTRARALLEESLAMSRELGYKQDIARAVDALGCVAFRQGNQEEARASYAEGLRLCLELDDRPNAASCLDGLASVAHRSGETARAARLFAAAAALRATIRTAQPPVRGAARAREVVELRTRLGEVGFAVAWAEGRAMTPEQAIADALGDEAGP